ncbi:MAG: S8 family serine peptidase [Burkholderiaceae bacterium]
MAMVGAKSATTARSGKASSKKAVVAKKKTAPAKKAAPKKTVSAKKTVLPAGQVAAKKPLVKKAVAKKLPPAKIAPAAKKAAAKTAPKRIRLAEARPLDDSLRRKLADLMYQARQERKEREESLSDLVVVQADSKLSAGSAEAQTVSALSQGNMAMMRVSAEPGKEPPRIDIVRHLGTSMAMRANDTALSMVRRSSLGLRIFSAAYLYPQYIRPLGDDLAAHALKVASATKVTRIVVRLRDPAGQPIGGVKVRAMLDWLGTNLSARSDANGDATLEVPVDFPRLELIMAEPDHTHWSQYAKGFDRATAPAILEMTLLPLLPDGFELMQKYAPHDPDAGQGVTVGVIDSGVGPHADLTVVGGACTVSGEDSTDFTDNGIGHGTHVAGIIAGKLGPSGLYGVAPACRLMSYRVCPQTGNRERAESVDVAAAIEQAIIDQCDLINISLGSLQAMPELPAVLEKARNAGIVVFASTGNDGQGVLRYPARYSHTLSVGALGQDATFPTNTPETFNVGAVRSGNEFVAAFSNHGAGTDFIGVGVAVLSTYPGDKYAMMSGTSMSAPFITGMAARLLSQATNVLNMARGPSRVDAIIAMLCASARVPGWPGEYGAFGVLV